LILVVSGCSLSSIFGLFLTINCYILRDTELIFSATTIIISSSSNEQSARGIRGGV
jgi:hypothetical protein